MNKTSFDTIIIGGGIAGLSAGMYVGRLGLKTMLIAKETGGAIALTHLVENYPPIKSISGQELSQKFLEHAKAYNINIKEYEEVKNIEKINEGFKVNTTKEEFITKTIIFATGTIWRKLDVAGSKDFENKGIHYCALCDGPFYKDKIVAIVGGSDSAAKEALLLSEYAKKVYIIYRGEEIRAEPINKIRVKENNKIEIINNTNIIRFLGDKKLNKVELDKEYNGKKELKLNGVFVAIGHIVLSDLAKSIGVITNKKGEIIIDREAKTNIDGFFAAGDVVDDKFKQGIISAGEAVMAAYSAYHYVKEKETILGHNRKSK